MVNPHRIAPALLVLLVASGCAEGRGPSIPSVRARELFEDEVVPILERRCGTSACHATSLAELPELNPAYFVFPVDDAGHVSGDERLHIAIERAQHALSPDGARFSELVRKPLDESLGGLPHRGGVQFTTMTDREVGTLMRWAESALPEATEMVPLLRRFADEVQPILARKGCMLSNCHGSGASNGLSLDPGVLGEHDRVATDHNYAKVVFFLNFDTPDPFMARLVRKTIPQTEGGIFHRGGNTFFARDDPDLAVIARFMTAVREARGEADTGVVSGLVFAATDPTPRRLFDIDTFQAGGDIYSLVPPARGGRLTNLTQVHHGAPADIRDPSVSYDGARVAFAMRRDEEDCLNLYVMDVDGSRLTQLTHDTGRLSNGIKVSSAEPLWGPDDRIYFTSTKAGVLADGGRYPLSNIYRIDADGSGLVRMTFSADNEVSPSFRPYHAPGRETEVRTLDLELTAVRAVADRRQAPLMRVPPDFRADYHPHYGTQHPRYGVFTAASVFPDDREALIVMDDSNLWEGGALAIVDRNIGPLNKNGLPPAVVNYVDSLAVPTLTGEEVSHRGVSRNGYYRDPLAMPDGSIVVTFSDAPISHDDPEARPDPALYSIVLRERPSNLVEIAERIQIADVFGKVETDVTPIMVRRREEILDPYEHLTAGQPYGELLNFDLALLMTIASDVSPAGAKDFDEIADAIEFVRVVEQVPLTPLDFPAWPDTSVNRIGRGSHGIRRIIAETQTAPDQSFYLQLPAAVPFYVQALDLERTTLGTHNLWVFVLPGEHLKNVTRREVYNTRCSGCHGGRSGRPGDSVATPDVLTQASRVLANYDSATDTDREPIASALDPSDRIEVDFERDVQPVLNTRCAMGGCHGSGERLDLSARGGDAGFSGAYEALTAPGDASGNGFAYADAMSMRAKTSYLAEVITGRELEAPRDNDSTGCAAAERLTLEEVETLFRWLDLGASYVGIGPRTAPTLPEYDG